MSHARRPFLLFAIPLVASGLFAATLPDSPQAVSPIPINQQVPAVAVIGAEGNKVALVELVRGKPTILIFYRGGWCPFCNTHLAMLAENELALRKLGFQIIGITADKPEALAPTATKAQARYKLYSDRTMQAAGAFGIAFRLSPEAGSRYKENDIDVPPAPDGQGYWQPVPSAFILSADGFIRFVYHNPDPAEAIGAEQLMNAARAIAARVAP